MPIKESKLKELRKEISYKWKPQTCGEHGATCVGYIDARDLFNLLDDVVGPGNWSTEYSLIKDQMFCKMGIYVEYENGKTEWVYKMDTGVEGDIEIEKSAVSDAAKRVGIQFGAGRFLYSLDIQRLKTKKHTNNKYYPIDNKGNILWTSDDLTEYINNKLKKSTPEQTPNSQPEIVSPTSTPATGTVTTPGKVVEYSNETINRVKSLEKNGKHGKEVIKDYIVDFNKVKGTSYKSIMDLNTDTIINEVVDFIKETPPKGMTN